jgi:hypothetical protein
VVGLALLRIQIDFFALNLVLPQMAESFQASDQNIQWTIRAYMLSLGVTLRDRRPDRRHLRPADLPCSQGSCSSRSARWPARWRRGWE